MANKFRRKPKAEKPQAPPIHPAAKGACMEAIGIVYGRGEKDYGHPRKNFQHTADLWNAHFQNILGDSESHKFTAEDVAYAMILVKLSRQENLPKRDNLVDICGYAETALRCMHPDVSGIKE